MKKLIALVLSLIIAVPFLVSCREEDNGKLKIITTIFPYYDICREIAGDNADVTMLVPTGGEVHEFEPTPQDIVDINKADIFIYNGGESDEWVERILDSVESDVTVLNMFDYAELVKEQDIDHNEGDEYDEHIWTSVSNMEIMTKTISRAITEADSENSKTYKKNTEKFLSKLSSLDGEIKEVVSGAKRKTLVFADRFPLLYFTKEYGLDYVSAFPGCSSETQPSIKTVKRLTDYVVDNDIPVVFHVDNTNENLADTICGETGAKTGTFYSCHNITKSQDEDNMGYISLMELNVKSLKEALS